MDNTIEQWNQEQIEMAKKVCDTDTINPNNIKLIGGVDISFDKNDADRACVYISVYDINTMNLVYEDHEVVQLSMQYVPGYLGFREVQHYKTLLNRIPYEYKPDIIMVDGFGILHPRGAGSATHLSIESGIPTIGVG